MPDLPRPVSVDQIFFARLCDLLVEQNDLLRQTLTGRQEADIAPQPADGPQPVALREPEPAATPPAGDGPGPQEIDLREPDPPSADKPATRPARATGRRTKGAPR